MKEDIKKEAEQAQREIILHVGQVSKKISEQLVEGEYCLYFNPDVQSILIVVDKKTEQGFKAGDITVDQTADLLRAAVAFMANIAQQHLTMLGAKGPGLIHLAKPSDLDPSS